MATTPRGTFRPPTLSDWAYWEIKQGILRCEIKPEAMINAAALAERLEVSRSPVMEALKRLSSEGWVQAKAQVGHIVAPVTTADIRETFQLRVTVEGLAADLATRLSTDEDIDDLSQSLERGSPESLKPVHRAKDEAELFYQVLVLQNFFHARIAQLSGNAELFETVKALLEKCLRPMVMYLKQPDWETDPISGGQGDFPHRRIVEAMRKRDRKGSARAIGEDITKGLFEILMVADPGSVAEEGAIEFDNVPMFPGALNQ